MKILGIDPGTVATGYGVVEAARGGLLRLVCQGVVRPGPRLPLSGRLNEIAVGLNSIMALHAPDAVAIETVFYAVNAKSAITLAHARGVAMLISAQAAVPVYEYAPRSIKLSVTGYGNAEKEQVQKMIGIILKTKEVTEPDAADALAAALCHINHSAGVAGAKGLCPAAAV